MHFQVVVWCSVNTLVVINEVNLRRARLVLEWVPSAVPIRYPGTQVLLNTHLDFFTIVKSAKVWCSCIIYDYLK